MIRMYKALQDKSFKWAGCRGPGLWQQLILLSFHDILVGSSLLKLKFSTSPKQPRSLSWLILPQDFLGVYNHVKCWKTHPASNLFCVLGKQHHASSTFNSALLFSNSNCAFRSSWRRRDACLVLDEFWSAGCKKLLKLLWTLTLSNRFEGKQQHVQPCYE